MGRLSEQELSIRRMDDQYGDGIARCVQANRLPHWAHCRLNSIRRRRCCSASSAVAAGIGGEFRNVRHCTRTREGRARSLIAPRLSWRGNGRFAQLVPRRGHNNSNIATFNRFGRTRPGIIPARPADRTAASYPTPASLATRGVSVAKGTQQPLRFWGDSPG